MNIIDVFSKESRSFFSPTDFADFAKVSVSTASKFMKGGCLSCRNRYIKQSDMDRTFVLRCAKTGEEFLCINAMTMEFYLGKTLSRNELAKLSNLKNDKLLTSKLNGRLFLKKGSDSEKVRFSQKRNSELYKTKDKAKRDYRNNREANIKRKKEWSLVNRTRVREYNKAYFKNRYENDTPYRLKQNLRNRLRMALKTNKKASTTLGLTGCDLIFLKSYLESKFKKGMNWENYGNGWSIDHIVPCCSFDMSDEASQKRCFHYLNLQPLWNHENLKKGSSLSYNYSDV